MFFIFYAVVTVLQLNTMHWLLSETISVGIIAFVILFQPELRKVLEQLGNGKFIRNVFKFEFQDEDNGETAAVVEEIVTASRKMAAVKTGALILVERKVPLGDHIRTGIALDAIVTSQLLINIFEKNTPLHDGAVVIRNNRVAAAACFLPLTENRVKHGAWHKAQSGHRSKRGVRRGHSRRFRGNGIYLPCQSGSYLQEHNAGRVEEDAYVHGGKRKQKR